LPDYFPVASRGKVMALFYLAIPVGSALGYVYGGFVNQRLDWRWVFWLVVPFELLLATLCYFRREPRSKRVVAHAQASLWQDIRRLLKIRSYVLNTIAMAAMTFAIGAWRFGFPNT
jgi:MFS family permease